MSPVAADFTPADLERLAKLTRLELTDDEKVLFARQVSDVLAFARQVQNADTSAVAPTAHPVSAGGPMRDDDVRPSLARAETLSQAPDANQSAGLFKVPRVLGG